MKRFSKIFTILLVVTIVSACGNEENNQETSNVEISTENLATTDYLVEGMVCAMGCSGTIQKEVSEIAGVVVSEVDYEAGKAHFEFDEKVVSEKEIINKIESIADGQYKVSKWEEKEIEIEEELEVETEEKSITELSLPSFEVPNLFTLLLDQI